MNRIITSKEEILSQCKEMFVEEGVVSLSIRNVALACNVSIGTIYNYFDSKSELIDAVIESIWSEIFHHQEKMETISECIEWLYDCIDYGNTKFPGFFTFHSFGDKDYGKERMENMWNHILASLESILEKDEHIRKNAFNEQCTPRQYASMIFSIFLADMIRHETNKKVLLEIIQRTLY